MSGYYNSLTTEEQNKVLAALAGLKLHAKRGETITRNEINIAFSQATGKQLSQEYMRDPSVVQLMGLLAPSRLQTGAVYRGSGSQKSADPSIAITDRNLAARGLPVPKSAASLPGVTRYSAGSRFGR